MPSRCRVFNRLGLPMAEIEASFDRAWVLNDAGEMEFAIAQSDRKAKREFLEFGTFILVEHDKLPNWGGVIETPRRWSGDGQITVSAKSAEWLLTYRVGDDLKLTGNAGAIFKQAIALANKAEDLYIREGSIYIGGGSRQETLQAANILEDLKGLAGRADHDFDLEPKFADNNTLYFEANWYVQKGTFRPDIPLMEGHNIELPDGDFLTEQGTIINEVFAYGDGANGSSRIKQRVVDATSRADYRLRQGSKYFPGDELVGTLLDNTKKKLDEDKNPEKVFRLLGLDVGNTFSLRLGDIVPLELYSVGFAQAQNGEFGLSTTVRVVGMRFNDEEGKLDLVTKEIVV